MATNPRARRVKGGTCDGCCVGEQRDDIDAALDTAVERVRVAEDRFVETPDGTPAKVAEAYAVEQRAEDVEELATQAVEASEEPSRPV
jgi:hypothetical protein